MTSESSNAEPRWDEYNSQHFIDYGKYFVPDRENQIDYICSLIPAAREGRILDLGCGEGILSEALLDRFPGCEVHGLDGSPPMLRAAQERLARHAGRFVIGLADLADTSWRRGPWEWHAVASSLAIHHLDDAQKQQLFKDVYSMLRPGGAFIVADIIQPTTSLSTAVAARMWDEAIQERSLKFEGDLQAYDHFQRTEWNSFRLSEPDPVDKMSPLLDQLKWMEQAGFTGIDVYWLRAGHAIFGGQRAEILVSQDSGHPSILNVRMLILLAHTCDDSANGRQTVPKSL